MCSAGPPLHGGAHAVTLCLHHHFAVSVRPPSSVPLLLALMPNRLPTLLLLHRRWLT